jgi:NADH-quinone oxidoreductase subunit G
MAARTTLGVRNNEIIRANNADQSGINGEFLCIKGRYAFDFTHHPDRLQSPLMKLGGKLEPVSWSQALTAVAKKFAEIKARGGKFGVIGSTRTTNEENFYLQKFARQGPGDGQYRPSSLGRCSRLVRRAGRESECVGLDSRPV